MRQKTYNKVLDAQVRTEAAGALQKVFKKPKETLDEKLKDPNSIESKALATMIVVIVASQWLEGLIAKAAAELHYVEKMIRKDAAPNLTMQGSSSEDDLEEEANQDQQPRLTTLQDMLTNVKAQLVEFKQQRADLEEQYQEAVEQLKAAQSQQLNDTFAGFDMTATPEQIQQVRQLVTQKADEGFLNKLAIDSYEKMQQQHNQGPSILRRPDLPAPPPPPPLAVVKERVVRGYDVAIEVASVASLMAIHRSNHELGDSIRIALKAFPVIRAVIQGQKDSLENLDKFFAEHKRTLDQKITDLEGKETTLGKEIRSLISANLSPSMAPSFNSRYGASEQSKQDEEGSALGSTKPSPFRSGSGF